ncbi:MAG: tryptophan--tRNA ligase [Enterobacteriaceae bacterium]
MNTNKKLVFSAIQPSGSITIGNYFGVIKKWLEIQYKYKCFYCIADLHAMTNIFENKNNINSKSLDLLSLLISCGINPNKNVIFMQSQIPEHTQLYWVLSCYLSYKKISSIPQFKYSLKEKNSINLGYFNYPVLMAADILLYKSNYVPVGLDQIKNIEFTRYIAKKFNNLKKNMFVVPKPIFSKSEFYVMSLKNPKKKMSKSDINKKNSIFLLEDITISIRKIFSAVTDSDKKNRIIYDKKNKPGISNLLNILSSIKGISVKHLEIKFKNKNYFHLKNEVSNELSKVILKIQNKYKYIRKNELYLKKILEKGKEKASFIAKYNLKKVYKKLELI